MEALLFAFLVLAVVVGLAVAYALYWRKYKGPALWAEFLTRTGYRRAADPQAPVEAQARAILADILPRDGVVRRGPWIRDVRGLPLQYDGSISSGTAAGEQAMFYAETWRMRLPAASSFGLQLVDRSIAQPGTAQLAARQLLRKGRSWSAVFPTVVASGEPIFDARVLALSDVPAEAAKLLGDWHLRQRLLDMPEIDLVLSGTELRFDDPSGTLRRTVMGAWTGSPTTMIQREPEVHEHVAELLRYVAGLLGRR